MESERLMTLILRKIIMGLTSDIKCMEGMVISSRIEGDSVIRYSVLNLETGYVEVSRLDVRDYLYEYYLFVSFEGTGVLRGRLGKSSLLMVEFGGITIGLIKRRGRGIKIIVTEKDLKSFSKFKKIK